MLELITKTYSEIFLKIILKEDSFLKMFKPSITEFYKLDKDKTNIGLLMMVKNEEKRIHVSLESVLGIVEAIIIYDTGSTDDTIKIITTFANQHKINLYLIQGEFEDFSTSRNISLEFAESVNVKYLLMLDSNDELKGKEKLLTIAKDFENKNENAFLLCQQWLSKDGFYDKLDKYYNVRFIKNRFGWRYKGSVHEWLSRILQTSTANDIIRIESDVITIFQDRTKDDDKSLKRFIRDRECLLKDLIKNPNDARTVFYLGQTCQCLRMHDESLYYNRLRTELGGFEEEIYHAYFRCGLSAVALNHSWDDVMPWFLKAFQHSERAEPLVKIAQYYRSLADTCETPSFYFKGNKSSNWKLAFMFIDQACKLSYPSHFILFVDKAVYDYERWHLLGIIGFYAGEFQRGKEGCQKALLCSKHKELDEKNLSVYIEIEKKTEEKKRELENNIKAQFEKKKEIFIDETINKLKLKFPRTKIKKIKEMAETSWKNLNKDQTKVNIV